jgi:hypothetical protein
MIQEGRNISEFRPGQILVRLEPAKWDAPAIDPSTMTATAVEVKDGSYRGEPMEYIGNANNMIYVHFIEMGKKGRRHSLKMEQWADGWGLYVDPDKLFQVEEKSEAVIPPNEPEPPSE